MSFWFHFYLNQAETTQKRKKNHSEYRFCQIRTGAFPKKIEKKKVILASFLAKPCWDMPKNRKTKFVPSTVSIQPGLQHS